MYTQVSFGQFVEKAEANTALILDHSPEPKDEHKWRYRIDDFDVVVYRTTPQEEHRIPGPLWDDPTETTEIFETRFRSDLRKVIGLLRRT